MGDVPAGLYEHLGHRGPRSRTRRPPTGAHAVRCAGPGGLARSPDPAHRPVCGRALRAAGGSDDRFRRRQVELANRIVAAIGELAPDTAADAQSRRGAGSHACSPSQSRGAFPAPSFPARAADIPLSTSALLVNGRGQPRIGYEVTRELASADDVDLLCAFIKWQGLRVLEKALLDLRERGGRLRVITTTYMGATDQRALDRLVELGADVKISYETRTTRLHAKAWLFRRATGHVDRVRRLVEPVPDGVDRRAGVERSPLQRRAGAPPRDLRRDVRQLLGRPVLRDVRPGPGRRPAPRGAQRGARRPHRPAHRDHVARRPPVRLPAGDPRRARGRAHRPRPVAQSRRDGDRHRQDRRLRPRLQAAARRRNGRPDPLHRPPRRAAGPEPVHVPARAPAGRLRRALRRRPAPAGVAPRLRLGPVADASWTSPSSTRRTSTWWSSTSSTTRWPPPTAACSSTSRPRCWSA